MKAIKYLLLIMLCFYGEQIYSQKKAVWVPDSIASQISVIQNQAREWKQHTDENPKDEKAWMRYVRTIQTLKSLTPGDDIEKEINEMMDKMKKEIPNTATYALIQNMILPFGKNDMTFDEIMDKWPDAVMHNPTYMALSFHNKNRLKDVSIRWYQSGTYPLQSLNYTYNELASAEKDALIFTDVNWTLFGSYLLQYGKGLFNDKKVIFSALMLTPFSMNELTEELGIPEFKDADPEFYKSKTPTMTFANEMKKRIEHIAKYTNRPIYISVSTNEAVKDLLKDHLYTEGLLMRYSAKPYDNLAVMRRNFENTYLLDYLYETFYPETLTDVCLDLKGVKMLSIYYVPAFKSLLQFYKESGDVTHYDKLHALLESIIKKADYYNEEVRERYLKSINF